MNKLCCEFLGNPQIFVCEKNTQKMLLPNCECVRVRVCMYVCLLVCMCWCVFVCVYVAPVFLGAGAGKPPFF